MSGGFFMALSFEVAAMTYLIYYLAPFIPWFPGLITLGIPTFNYFRHLFRKD